MNIQFGTWFSYIFLFYLFLFFSSLFAEPMCTNAVHSLSHQNWISLFHVSFGPLINFIRSFIRILYTHFMSFVQCIHRHTFVEWGLLRMMSEWGHWYQNQATFHSKFFPPKKRAQKIKKSNRIRKSKQKLKNYSELLNTRAHVHTHQLWCYLFTFFFDAYSF